MPKVFLGLGSNTDPYHYLEKALDTLHAEYGTLAISPVYESDAVGFVGDRFLNLVVAFDTDLPLGTLARQLRAIEHANGRPPGGPKFSPRTLDIDILLYGELCGAFNGLTLPRDEIDCHAFALRPLADLAPDALHPVKRQSYGELWAVMEMTQGAALTRVPFHWRGCEY